MTCCFATKVTSTVAALPDKFIGVNLAGAEFGATLPGTTPTDYVWPTSTEIDYYYNKGFNLFRVPFKWERIQPTANAALNTTYRDALLNIVDLIRAKPGAWVLIDMHNYWRYFGSFLSQAAFVDVWTRIAQALSSRDRVILGLMNEPNGVAATTVVTGYNAVIAAVRGVGYQGWISCAGTAWTGAHSWVTSGNAAAFTSLPVDDKLLIEAHQYLDADGAGDTANCALGTGTLAGNAIARLTPFYDWLVANDRVGFIGEWSYTPSDTTCQSWVLAMLSWVDARLPNLRGMCYWANYPTAYGPHDSNVQLLNPFTGGVDRPQIATITGGVAPDPTAGDRNPVIRRVFPTAVYSINGGRVVNIRQAPYNAQGDDTTDDSNAFIAFFEFLRQTLIAVGRNQAATNYVLYIPTGRYKCTKELSYTGSISETNLWQNVHVLGEDRRSTTLRLADGASGYTTGTKAFLNLNKTDFNNLETSTVIQNLTIDTGSGNPAAVGVRLGGPNGNWAGDLTFKGTGRYGLYLVGGAQFWIRDITVTGFEVGVGADHEHVTNFGIEHGTFSGQSVAAIQLGDATCQLRDVKSTNSVPALKTTGVGPAAVIKGCVFTGGSASNAAVDITSGTSLHVRDLTVSGYGSAVKKNSVVKATGNISKFTTAPNGDNIRISTKGGASPGLLTVEDVPLGQWPAAIDWEVVTTNSNAAAQAAMNSGKPGVMFKGHTFSIGSVTVPSTVKYIYCGYAFVNGTLTIQGGSASDPITVEAVSQLDVQHGTSPRPVVMLHTKSSTYNNSSPTMADKAFLCAMASMGNGYGGEANTFGCGPQKVWARMINHEPKMDNNPTLVSVFNWDGTDVWVFGAKTETNADSHHIKNHGRLEIVGAMANQTSFQTHSIPADENSTIIRVTDATAYVSMHTNGFGNETACYRFGVKNTRDGTLHTVTFDALPVRNTRPGQRFIPLFEDQDNFITISWDASTDNVGVAGYELDKKTGTGAFGLLVTTSNLTYTDYAVVSGTSYQYRVRSFDAAGNYSAYATPVTQVMP